MNRVLDIDVANRRVRVEPGLVLDDLNEALAVHGMIFGPDPSTHTHCTMGGMLGNNSCGVHSVMAEFHGPGARTSDHVIEMEIVTYDGLRMRVGKTSDQELALLTARPDPASEIYRQLVALRVSGYPIDELLPEHGFHVARALVGTESTCVTILEATLAIYPLKKCKSLVVLGYPSVYEAADHVPQI